MNVSVHDEEEKKMISFNRWGLFLWACALTALNEKDINTFIHDLQEKAKQEIAAMGLK